MNTKAPHIVLITVLCVFASLGSVIITPALPSISQDFSTSQGTSQLTVTLFLLGYALGQLLYGPFANRYGRIKTLHAGLMVAMLGTLFSLLSSPLDAFSLLLFGRFVEALGCSVGLVVGAIMINDYYPPQTVHKQFAVVIIGNAVVPGTAVFIGGFLSQHFHWQACFYFILVYNMLLFLAVRRLPETLHTENKEALALSTLVQHYKKLLGNRMLLILGSLFGLSISFVYVFSAEGPFIGINSLDMSPAAYGIVALIPSVGLLAGGAALRVFGEHITREQALLWGVLIEGLGSLLLLGLFLAGHISVYTLIIPICVIFIGHGCLSSVAMSMATASVHDKAMGTSVASFCSLAIPVLATYMTTLSGEKSPMLLPATYGFLIVLMAVLMKAKSGFSTAGQR